MRRWRISLAPAWLIGVAALVMLVWPRPTDGAVREAYRRLSAAAVPVRVIGWTTPTAAQSQLSSEGYTLSVQDPSLGALTISGERGGSPSPGATLSWNEGDTVYTVTTSADPALVVPRVVPLDDALHQFEGSPWDTPVLYLWYLPLLVGVMPLAAVYVLFHAKN
jgi:hypothetical protein